MNGRETVGGKTVEAVSLEISELLYKAAWWRVRSRQRTGCMISFSGIYRPGSSGKHDGMFIRWRTREVIELVRPHGLVVSFEELDYEYGDDLDLPWSVLDGPMQIVCSNANRAAIRGIFGESSLNESIDDAVALVSSQIAK